ncbi:MAG: LuxR C-terminal-related transcriptional regulator [Hyphomicrobiales bacterium]|nr:LuxR C-terminal-related transcriptional regulator [Hyphomicrobiales bacterium]
MSGIPEVRAVQQTLSAGRRTLFGITPGSETRTTSIPDAVRRARWIAVDIGASVFGLYLVGPSAERGLLVPCFDSSYPSTAAETRLVAGQGRPGLVKHIRTSSVPLRWSDLDGADTCLGKLDWAVATEPVVEGTAGLAFPVHAEHGQCGLAIFMGSAIALSPAGLFDIHARCFSLFEAVTRIRAVDGLPSISKRELECLRLTANGYTSDEIARLLKLSVHTANQYLTNTTQKLDAVNRMHAVAKALRLGLIE